MKILLHIDANEISTQDINIVKNLIKEKTDCEVYIVSVIPLTYNKDNNSLQRNVYLFNHLKHICEKKQQMVKQLFNSEGISTTSITCFGSASITGSIIKIIKDKHIDMVVVRKSEISDSLCHNLDKVDLNVQHNNLCSIYVIGGSNIIVNKVSKYIA